MMRLRGRARRLIEGLAGEGRLLRQRPYRQNFTFVGFPRAWSALALRYLFLHFSKPSSFSITETLYSLTYCASRQAKLLINHQTTRTHIATSAVYRLLSLVACYHLDEGATLFDSFAAELELEPQKKAVSSRSNAREPSFRTPCLRETC